MCQPLVQFLEASIKCSTILRALILDLRENDTCTTANMEDAIRLPTNIDARETLRVDNTIEIPCMRGLVCRRESVDRSVCRDEAVTQGKQV